MHARTEVTTVKLIGPRCAINFIEEYSRRHNYNRTFDLWIWTNDPDAIPKMAWLGLASPDDEPVPIDTPVPDIDPMHNPPLSGPKDGWSSPVIIHLDTLEDHQPRPMLYKQYEWSYGAYDDVSRSRSRPLPIPCRLETSARFKQPLTPRSLKMIADLVKKGGCKKLKLKAAKGKAAVAPA
ncbi:hypothetical protein OsI_30438 [Oryza sativa Indica Group]|uniref:Uncharacterized protein n=1 Tax=Oryza sativa subsp. indica TaxID=39946 RepID=B8BD09_ORYSI|nr:hypothetical protein OsI_30438 [Oryza sativa Indica Group]